MQQSCTPYGIVALSLLCLAFFGLGSSFWFVSWGIGYVCFWEAFFEQFFCAGVFGGVCEVGPFHLVVVAVVEFLGSVAVSDVSEPFGSEGVVVSAVSC